MTSKDRLVQVLKDASIEESDRIKIIETFLPGRIQRKILTQQDVLFRFHNGDDIVKQYGRYFTDKQLTDVAVARKWLAIPNENKMFYLDVYQPLTEVEVFIGEVAPLNEMEGGGMQIFVPGFIKEKLKVIKRIRIK